MQLKNLIAPHLDLPRLSKDLDDLGHFARTWAVGQWTRADMATLWEGAKGFRPLSLDDFVPSSVEAATAVIHHGKNSLPVLTHFQKRFARPANAERHEELLGFNVQSLAPLTGPGYFVVHAGAEPGEVDIDYTRLPCEQPAGWPPIAPNTARLGRFVFAGMVDVMRGLSTHVTIGRPRRKEHWLDSWFVLVREDPPPAPPPS